MPKKQVKTTKRHGGRRSNKNPKRSNQGSGVASTIGKFAGQLLRAGVSSATGIPFEVSGTRAVATPSSALGPIQVSAPAANGLTNTTTAAKMRSGKSGSMSVCHREFVCDVMPGDETNDLAFQLLVAQYVNPGNPVLFPWLSSIAKRFDSYLFRRLKFVYEPQCPTTAAGTIMLVVDYDAGDTPPINKTQMMAYKNAVRSPPWFVSANVSDPKDLQKTKSYYISEESGVSSSEDVRLTNVGKIYLAYEGPATEQFAAGELYVEYEVELMTPSLEATALSGALTSTVSGTPTQVFGSLKQTGPNKPVPIGMGAQLYVGVEVPGVYLMALYANLTGLPANTTNYFDVTPAPGSNATVGKVQESAVLNDEAASGSLAAYATCSFPNDSDFVVVTIVGGGSYSIESFELLMAPFAQSTTNFPDQGTTVEAMNLARKKAALVKSIQLNTASLSGKEIAARRLPIGTPDLSRMQAPQQNVTAANKHIRFG